MDVDFENILLKCPMGNLQTSFDKVETLYFYLFAILYYVTQTGPQTTAEAEAILMENKH